MQLSRKETEFKLDTGAEVTAISEQTYQRLSSNPLTPPGKQLYGPAHNTIDVLGKFDGILSYQGEDSNQIIYVVKELRTNLLGLPAIKSINLIARLGTGGECEFFTEFSSLFEGLDS